MEEALTRQEYPAMLEHLPPAGAVAKLNERVKKIGKVNHDIADWLQERRKVEDAYVAGLKKLVRRPLQDAGNDLGIFDAPWKKIVSATENIARSHGTLSNSIDNDVEQPLRNFVGSNREMQAMTTIQGNLAAMARELDSAQEKSDKLTKKGGKASTHKVEAATSQLQSARQQWDSQAPFIFETLQALDEKRLNHLRDVLTQYQTHEADQVERNRVTVEETLAALLEIDTAHEIRAWSHTNDSGRISTRRPRGASSAASIAPTTSSLRPPPIPTNTDSMSQRSSEQSTRQENAGESKLKSRFGTMLGRRRQSVHAGFAQVPSPSRGGFGSFGRNLPSREGRPHPSPRASSNNLRESPSRDNRLSALAESPTKPSSADGANGVDTEPGLISDALPTTLAPHPTNGTNPFTISTSPNAQPPLGPPPSELKLVAENATDSEGFSLPASMNDPISLAQQEAAQENDQTGFKLDIREEPIHEQDADAQAALSNVANTLRFSQAVTPTRKLGTIRGRRDVRNTIYVPQSLEVPLFDNTLPPSPGNMVAAARASTMPVLPLGDHYPTRSASDTTSIRSGYSLSNNVLVKHADMFQPGLNTSVIETITASFADGAVQTTRINGEVALVYNKAELDEISPTNLIIRINNFPNLEAIGPNRTFIHPVSDEKPDEYTIDVPSITPKSAVAFTYKVHIDHAFLISSPLLLKPAWKPQGDKLALVIEYRLNPAYSSEPVLFHNLVIIATYAGARATACQTKPTGTHLKEKSLVYWRLGDLTLSEEWHKVICRFVGVPGAVPEPGHAEAKWEIQGTAEHLLPSRINFSRLEAGKGKENQDAADPFADESVSPAAGNWVSIESSKKLVAGKYEAQ